MSTNSSKNHAAQPGHADSGADDVLELLHAITHQMRGLQFQALRDGPHALTHMDSRVLGFFGRHPGATQSDLAAHSGRDKAQLARLIKGLRERGLLTAQAAADDRRQVRLTLTADGVAVQRQLQQQSRQVASQAVAGLTAQDRSQLVALLQRLQLNLAA